MYVTHLLGTLDAIKVYHWQTKSYARHKATDALYKTLGEQIDQFVEVHAGESGKRPEFNDENNKIALCNCTDDEAEKYLKEFYEWLSTTLKKVAGESIALNHLIEEMASAVNQALYLFTFNC